MQENDITGSEDPHIQELAHAFNVIQTDLSVFLNQKIIDYQTRFSLWSGQTKDQRKHSKDGKSAFPWDGAADIKVPFADEYIYFLVTKTINALRKSRITAHPVEGNDIAKANVVSNFLRWMIYQQIPNFFEKAIKSANDFYGKGVSVSYQYWKQVIQNKLEKVTLDEFILNPEDPISEDELKEMITNISPTISKKRLNKLTKDLLEFGEGMIPVQSLVENRPDVMSLDIDKDIFFPLSTTDIQEAPYIFQVMYFTKQQLYEKIITEDWDKDWVSYVCEHFSQTNNNYSTYNGSSPMNPHQYLYDINDSTELIKVIYCYRKITDEDNITSLYLTIFHEGLTDELSNPKPYAKHDILNYSHGKYPFVVTAMESWDNRIYETRSVPEIAEGWQMQYKTEVDSLIDRNSLSTLPPMQYRLGRKPSEYGPGKWVPYHGARNEVGPMEQIPLDPGNMEARKEIRLQADKYFGRPTTPDDTQEALERQQFFILKFLNHYKQVIDQLFALYQQFGPEEQWFRVIGVKDLQNFVKGEADDRYDFHINYDVLLADSETFTNKVKLINEILPLDRSGVIDVEAWVKTVVDFIDVTIGDQIIQPKETATAKAVEEELSDLAKVYSGADLEVNEQDQHQIKLQVLQGYIQGAPDVQNRLQTDEAFKQRIENRVKKRQFQLQQQQNAVIGRVGGQPGQFNTG